MTITRLGLSWSQADLGAAIDLKILSVLGEMGSSGTNGLVLDILVMLQKTLGPMLVRLKRHRDVGCAAGVRSEAHRIKSSASQLGDLRLAGAAGEILKRVPASTAKEMVEARAVIMKPEFSESLPVVGEGSGSHETPRPLDELAPFADALIVEVVRLQGRLNVLLPKVS